jgi:hypothetical protein
MCGLLFRSSYTHWVVVAVIAVIDGIAALLLLLLLGTYLKVYNGWRV